MGRFYQREGLRAMGIGRSKKMGLPEKGGKTGRPHKQ